MRRNHFLSMCLASCLAMLSTGAMAQTLYTTDARDTYQVGETVSIKYEGAQAGDRIIIYHNLSILPLAEALDVEQAEGVYDVPPRAAAGQLYRAPRQGSERIGTSRLPYGRLIDRGTPSYYGALRHPCDESRPCNRPIE